MDGGWPIAIIVTVAILSYCGTVIIAMLIDGGVL